MGAGTGRRGGSRPGAGAPRGPKKKTLRILAKLEAAQELTAAAVLEKIRRALEWDVRKMFTAKGLVIPVHQLDDETAFLVQGIEYVTTNIDKGDGKLDEVVKVKVEPRARYVEMAAKYHGLLVDRIALESDKPLRVKVALARKRLAEGK